MKKRKSIKKRKLNGIPDIRSFFFRNKKPIYFVSATSFNLLGADEWVRGLKFINYIDCFDGQHPNVFVPEELPHDVFQSIEEINNYLLEHKEVVDFVQNRGKRGKSMFLMFDEQTEQIAKTLGLQVCFPTAKMRQRIDNKVETTRIGNSAGVPSVPNILVKVTSFKQLCEIAGHLGSEWVIQTPFGDSGHTTFFVANEADWEQHADEIVNEPEVKIMKRIDCRGAAVEACVTRHGTVVAPIMTELVGFPELTPYRGGWCGNEVYADAFTKKIRTMARRATFALGEELKKIGYRGYFEVDYLIDQQNGKIYLGEINPRITGASSITNHCVFALADIPLFLFHLLEWMDVDYKLSVRSVNARWARSENIDDWGQLIIKHTEDTLGVITHAPPSGIYKMDGEGRIQFSRFDTHRRAVENDSEAFFMRIANVGDYQYEGADLGILVMRGRLMTNSFKLNARAQRWIKAIRSQFKSDLSDNVASDVAFPAGIGDFKLF